MNNLGFDLKDWEEVDAIEMGDREVLALGGHEVIITDACLYTSTQTNNTSLKICVDIDGNDKQKGFFQKQYDNITLSEKKWPTGATRYLSLKKENLGYTKGFITALEKSNKGFKFDTSKGWNQIFKLKCAGVFGLEEYVDNEGKTRVATKLVQFRSLDKLKDIQIPKVKLLDGTLVDYEEYNKSNQNKKDNNISNAVEISPENLPF